MTPVEQVAAEAVDAHYIDVIVSILLERDRSAAGAVVRTVADLPEAARQAYEASAALAVHAGDPAKHWPAVYYALADWVGPLDGPNEHLPVDRKSIAQCVAGIIDAYKTAVRGDLPADELRRLGLMAFEDMGRKPADVAATTTKGSPR